MSLFDAVGMVGVVLMLGAYAAAQAHWLDTVRAPALTLNLVGSGLVMLSLTERFNLAAFMMELAWCVVAAYGLLRIAIRRLRGS